MKNIDTEILELFNKYYTLFKRDHPNNTSEAIYAAATLTQAQINKEGFANNTPLPNYIPPSYTYELDKISSSIDQNTRAFEQAKSEVLGACDRLITVIKQHE